MSRKLLYVILTVVLSFCAAYSQSIPEGVYVIKSGINNNFVIDLNNSRIVDGNNIQILEDNGTDAQKWKVTHNNGAIVLRSCINTNFVIDLKSSNARRGTNIQLWEYNGTNAQRWFPEKVGSNTYVLRSAINRDYVVDLKGSYTTNCNNIQAWDYNGTNAQRWVFVPVSSLSGSSKSGSGKSFSSLSSNSSSRKSFSSLSSNSSSRKSFSNLRSDSLSSSNSNQNNITSAVINNAWLEHDVTQNGVKGMKIHVNFKTINMKGKAGLVCAYFEYPKGTGLKDTNGRYNDSGGKVAIFESIKPGYDRAIFDDFVLFMPIDEIHMKQGEHTYYCKILIYDKSYSRFLNDGTYLTFKGTSNGENVGNQHNDKSNINEKVWREELGYGMFAITSGDPNGLRTRTIWGTCKVCGGTMRCPNCFGFGRCTICSGNGGIVTSGYGTYILCAACKSTGVCSMCKGTGKCICTTFAYPGYSPGATTMIGADGSVIFNSSGSGDGSSSSSSSSSSSTRSSGGSCSRCGGKGYESTPYTYAPASTYGWKQPYHSTGGRCPYCNRTDNHYHHPCSSCRGYGHN